MASVTKREPSSKATRDNPEGKPLVASEMVWLLPPDAENSGGRSRVKLTRWSTRELLEPLEVASDNEDDCHLVTFALRRIEMNLRVGKKEIVRSAFPSHKPLLHLPIEGRSKAVFCSPFNSIRIYLPQDLIREAYETVLEKSSSGTVELFHTHFTDDVVVEKLTHTLVALADEEGPYGPTLLDAAGLALGARLVALSKREPSFVGNASRPLATWRLRRTLDYLEANLTQAIYLADLADVAGLSRMHFASQFRAATGLAPHAYILKRRVELAQGLLLDAKRSIAEVSLQIGFSSQAHLTTAFKKVVGVSPGQWRSRLSLE